MRPVISFSVINYVVSMRRPRENGEVSFLFYITLRKAADLSDTPLPGDRCLQNGHTAD